MKNPKITAAALLFVCAQSAVFAAGNPEIIINGQKLEDCEAFIDENSRTQVPLRVVSESLGFTVDWDEASETVYISRSGKNISVKIGDDVLVSDDGNVVMDTCAVIINDRTYVPIRYLSEALGGEVLYDGEAGTVTVQMSDGYDTYAMYDPAKNTNPHGHFPADFFEGEAATPLAERWYSGNDIPENISEVFAKDPVYTAASIEETDLEEIKDTTFTLSDGNYTQDFWFDCDASSDFFTETFFTTQTGKIAVMIESDSIASDDIYIDLSLYKIEDGDDGKQAFFKEAWHKTFDKKAVAVFEDLAIEESYIIRVSAVDCEERETKEFSGTVTIAQVE